MSYVLNPFTGKLDAVGISSYNIDGGSAGTIYLLTQNINGGGA